MKNQLLLLISMIICLFSMQAQINYTSFNPDVLISADHTFGVSFCDTEYYSWDIDNDAATIDEFSVKGSCNFQEVYSQSWSQFDGQSGSVEIISSSVSVLYGGLMQSVMAANSYTNGATIGPNSGQYSALSVLHWEFDYTPFNTLEGNEKYVGFRVQLSDGVHYGWLRLRVVETLSLELHLIDYAYNMVPGAPILAGDGLVPNCPDFETAPVDLTKSFDPVGGVSDRVQLKWYKASPTVRYTDGDAAACDIKFWAKRNLDPLSGNPVGGAIQNPDTTTILNALKSYPDSSPKSIFKWPVKFKALGANNNKRVDPNIRYEWKVRCACEHGAGNESPWSEVKIFNTPDFDPNTGIYTGVIDWEENAEVRNVEVGNKLQLIPNPSDGSEVSLLLRGEIEKSNYEILVSDMTGKIVLKQRQILEANRTTKLRFLEPLNTGLYMISIANENARFQKKLLVK